MSEYIEMWCKQRLAWHAINTAEKAGGRDEICQQRP